MHYLYKITAPDTEYYYFGITNNVSRRSAAHKHASKTKKTPLYDWMRKHVSWSLEVLGSFELRSACEAAERTAIAQATDKCLNLAPGGEGGFVVQDKAAWVEKLKAARKGRKPSLGMNHTEETKERLRQAMAERERKYPDDVLAYGFAEAKRRFGISKTHYYRLKKRAETNELS